MKYDPVIGLEVHIQLRTKTKMFCGCANEEASEPNKNVCPVCLGHPGALPVPNKAAIEESVRMASAMGCRINSHSKFDRKNYFYPDLPKGYQISQFDLPIGEEGSLVINVPEDNGGRGEVRIGITRLHLEEDAAKNVHSADGKETYVDYNRGGVPLAEMVSDPDLRSPSEAKAYLQEVRLIARTLGISDAEMEKGHLRCDANISLRRVNDDGTLVDDLLHPKTEIKNLNSFRMVERAIAHEIERQTKLWEAGDPPNITTTRGWDDAKGVTVPQRTKEDSAEYRYFPDPDLPRMDLTEMAEKAKHHHPELPSQKRLRFKDEYHLTEGEAKTLVEDVDLSNYAEEVFSELLAWVRSIPEFDKMSDDKQLREVERAFRTTGPWLLNKWLGVLNAKKMSVKTSKVTAENFAELMTLLLTNEVTPQNALHILEVMTTDGADPSHVMEDEGLGRIDDAGAIANVVLDVIKNNPAEVERYRGGDEKLIQFFIGMVMKATEGRADAAEVRNQLLVELEQPTSK